MSSRQIFCSVDPLIKVGFASAVLQAGFRMVAGNAQEKSRQERREVF